MKTIIAVNNIGMIGLDDKMLWHCKDDLIHFKKLTYNSRLLVGFITQQGLPILKNRQLVTDIRNEFITDIDWCIGGKRTYEKYCHLFTELHISHIDNNDIGNVTFPNLTNLNKNCKIYNYNFK
jgi:dihydrofolate reductase